MIAALFVETNGCYFSRSDVDPWDLSRDARTYMGPYPVVAHPPCKRWGRFWHGSTRKPHQFTMGADEGCFAAALTAIRTWGGVLEHPAHSHAWAWFGLTAPRAGEGWKACDLFGGYSCYVEQGHYGHFSRKPTWLYACKVTLPELDWSPAPQRIHPKALAKHGYAKARRIGVAAMIGGKDKTRIREATPTIFRELLISMAESVMCTPEKARRVA